MIESVFAHEGWVSQTAEVCYLPVLEAGSPRSRCLQGHASPEDDWKEGSKAFS